LHPVVKQKYEEAEFDYFKNANDRNEEVFFEQTAIAKKPIKHYIIKVVRTKIGKDEHVYYHETLRSKDYLDNLIDHTHVIGKYEDPQFISSVDPQTRKPRQTEVHGFETKYEISWTPNIIDQWEAQDNFELDENIGYIVKQGGKTYGGYTRDQFCTETFDNLVTLGKFGTLEPAGIQKEIRKRNKQLASQ
jgi:hypothetical protein